MGPESDLQLVVREQALEIKRLKETLEASQLLSELNSKFKQHSPEHHESETGLQGQLERIKTLLTRYQRVNMALSL